MKLGSWIRSLGVAAGAAVMGLSALSVAPQQAAAGEDRIIVIQRRDSGRFDRGFRGDRRLRNAIGAGALSGILNQDLLNQAFSFREERLLERRERALDRAFRDERNGDFDRADRQFDRADRLEDRLDRRGGEVFLRGDRGFRDDRLLRSRSFRNGEIRSLGRSRRPVILLRDRDRCDF